MGGKTTQKTNQQQTQQVTLPAWMSEGGQANYNAASDYNKNNPVTAYTGPMTAGLSQNQQAASNLAANSVGQGQSDLNVGRMLTAQAATAPGAYVSAPQTTANTLGQAPTMSSVQQPGAATGIGTNASYLNMGSAPMISAMMAGSTNADAAHGAASLGSATTGNAALGSAYTGDAVTGTASMANAGTSEAALMQAAQRGDAHTYDAATQSGLPPAIEAMMVSSQNWDPTAAANYMNPYLSKVQGDVMSNMKRSNAEELASLNDGLVSSHAFGGARQGVLEAMTREGQNRNLSQYLNQSTSDAYTNAQNMFTSDQGRALQAALGNQSTKLQADTTNSGFIDAMLGRNLDATNHSREFNANAWNTHDSENTGWLNDAARTNADNTTNVGISNARNITDTNNSNADRLTTTSNSNAGLISQMINNNANRLTDTSNQNAGRITDTSNSNARILSDMSNSNANRLTDTSNQNAGRDTSANLQNAQNATDSTWRNADRTLSADQSNQDLAGRYAIQDNTQGNETNRSNADRAQAMDTSNLGWINQMMGANADREQQARSNNLDWSGKYAMADQDALNTNDRANADRSLQGQTTNAGIYQSMLQRMMAAGGQFGQFGQAANSMTGADISRLMSTGAVDQATQQAQDDAQYQEFLRMQTAPMDRYSQLAGILSGTPRDVSTNGTMNGTTVTKQSPGMMATMLGLAQVAAAAAPSDPRLKRDKRLVGKMGELGLWTYRYLWDAATAPLRVGVMADEVERLMPWALGPNLPGGFRTVDYSKLGGAYHG